jgi:hypothetical protein
MAIKKYGLNRYFLSGDTLISDVSGVNNVRFAVENVNAGNVFTVSVRIDGETTWDVLGTIAGDESKLFKTDTYDELKVEVTTYSPLTQVGVKLISSGYFFPLGVGGSGSVELVDGALPPTGSPGDVIIDPADDTLYYWKDPVGWTPIGGGTGGSESEVQNTIVDAIVLSNKGFTLNIEPTSSDNMILMIGPIKQEYGTDYVIAGDVLSWSGLGMEPLVELNDIISITIIN